MFLCRMAVCPEDGASRLDSGHEWRHGGAIIIKMFRITKMSLIGIGSLWFTLFCAKDHTQNTEKKKKKERINQGRRTQMQSNMWHRHEHELNVIMLCVDGQIGGLLPLQMG